METKTISTPPFPVDDVTFALRCSIEMEKALIESKEKSIKMAELEMELVKAQTQRSIFQMFTENFCQSFEGFFDSDERFASTEHYTEYLEAARYLQKLNFHEGRQGIIRRVEQEIDKMEQERLFGKSN